MRSRFAQVQMEKLERHRFAQFICILEMYSIGSLCLCLDVFLTVVHQNLTAFA